MTYAPGLGYAPRAHSSLNSKEDLNSILRALRSFSTCSPQVITNLAVFVRDGKIALTCKTLDVGAAYWDGELLITFTSDMSKEDLVNYIISGSYADEMQMVDYKTLRLWWD
jgi:hypothetical protein